MAVIFGLSAMSAPPEPSLPMSDKVIHGVIYALLGALMVRGLSNARWSEVTGATAVGAVVLSTLYGYSDELHQRFVPNRTPELADVLVDALGASCAAAGLWAWSIIKASRAGTVRRSASAPQPPG